MQDKKWDLNLEIETSIYKNKTWKYKVQKYKSESQNYKTWKYEVLKVFLKR